MLIESQKIGGFRDRILAAVGVRPARQKMAVHRALQALEEADGLETELAGQLETAWGLEQQVGTSEGLNARLECKKAVGRLQRRFGDQGASVVMSSYNNLKNRFL